MLEGNLEALKVLKSRVEPAVRKRLLARGASKDEADEVLSAVWASSIVGRDAGAGSLFAAYKGLSSPTTWLATVALNRWLDRKRREAVHDRWVREEQRTRGSSPSDNQPAPDLTLLRLLKDSLDRAFGQCDGESLVLLRLVHAHGLSQRALASTWGLPEYALSRRLTRTMKQISKATMDHIRQTDPWLDLRWEDFLELCQQLSDDANANSTGLHV